MGFTADLGDGVIVYIGIKHLNRQEKNVITEIVSSTTDEETGEVTNVTRNDRVRAVAVIQTLSSLGGNPIGINNREIPFLYVKTEATSLDDIFAFAYPFFKGDYNIVTDNI